MFHVQLCPACTPKTHFITQLRNSSLSRRFLFVFPPAPPPSSSCPTSAVPVSETTQIQSITESPFFLLLPVFLRFSRRVENCVFYCFCVKRLKNVVLKKKKKNLVL